MSGSREAKESGQQKPDPYPKRLVLLIFIATLFEGYDVMIINPAFK